MRRWGAAEEGAGGGNFVAVILFRKKKGGLNPPPPPSSPAAHHTQRAGCSLGTRRPRRVPACIYQAAPPHPIFFGKRIGLLEFNQKRIFVPVPPLFHRPPRVSLPWRA